MFSIHPHIRRSFITAGIIIAALFVLWAILWVIAAAQYQDFIDNWIDTHRAQGYELTYDDRSTAGFPTGISVHFSNLILRNSDGVRIHANEVLLTALPWRWQKFNGKLKHGFELAIPFSGGKTLFVVNDGTVHNHTELEDNGDWKFISLELTDAKALWEKEPFFSAGSFEIAFERPDNPPQNSKEAGITLTGTAEDLKLPPDLASPFGPDVKQIDVEMRVMGAVPDPRKKESVAAWTTAFGVVEFDKFFMKWGPLILLSRGTLGLDDDLQPEGAFSAQIGNHMAVLKTLMDQDYIPKRQQSMLDSALHLFTKEASVDGEPGIEAPIAVQLGGLFLGPVRVFEFSEINWGDEAPAAPAPNLTDPSGVIAPAPVAPSENK